MDADEPYREQSQTPPALPIEVIQGDQPRAEDYAILGAVREAVWQDDEVGRRPIGIDVHRGVVTLTGIVDDGEAKARALANARGVEGVREVIDRLRVREKTADPEPSPVGGGSNNRVPEAP